MQVALREGYFDTALAEFGFNRPHKTGIGSAG